MKLNFKKVLVVFCSMIMLLTTFSMVASAEWYYPEEYGGPPVSGYGNGYNIDQRIPELKNHTWHEITEVVKYEQTSKYLILTVKAGQYDEKLFISLPKEGGVRIQCLHADQIAAGIKEPVLNNDGINSPSGSVVIDYKKDGKSFIMKGTDGTVVRYEAVGKGFELQISNADERIVNISNRQIGFAYSGGGRVGGVTVEMPLIKNEGIIGGGERFNTTNQVGKKFSLVNVDTGTRNDAFTYGNIPLFHSNRGYSMWFNMNGVGKADIGCKDPEKMSIFYQMSNLDFIVWQGMPLENLKKYTDITGTSGVAPTWAYGFWTGAASSAWSNTKKGNAYENLVETLEGYMDNYGFYPDACYGEGENSQQARSINYAKQRDVKMLYWFWPAGGVITELLPGSGYEPMFDKNGQMIDTGYPFPYNTYMLKTYGVYKEHRIHTAWYDFSNPSAKDVVSGRFRELWGFGLKGSMTDYGELVPFGGTFFNGMDGTEMHNFNSYYYAKRQNEAWTEYHGGDYVLFQRSGVSGSQKWSGNFLGDQQGDWDGYTRQIYATINYGAAGMNLYGGDLGALLGGRPANDLWNRWVVFTVFSPYMRQHGTNIHQPWTDFDDLAAKAFGNYYYFRKNIVPSIESAIMDANKTSNPIVKGMMVAYPYQVPLKDVTTQYLFCDHFLVCPVLEANVWYQQVVLPKGSTWYDLDSYKAYKGGQVMYAEAPTSSMPVYVKGGSVKAINLPEDSLNLGDMMYDDSEDEYQARPALLVTPPDVKRTSTIHVMEELKDFRTYDSHTEVYTNAPGENSTFTVTNADGSPRQIIKVLGVTAANVVADGEKMTRLDHVPSYFQEEYGYYVDIEGMTTIVLPAGWKEIAITKGESTYKPLPWTMTYGTEALSITLKDDDLTTSGLFNTDYIEFALDEAADIGSIVFKWAVGYYNYYNIEYSADGENWNLLTLNDEAINTVEQGVGSVDNLKFNTINAKYFRVYPVEKGDVALPAALYDVSFYEPDTFVPLDVMEEEEEEDWEDEEWDEDEFDDWIDPDDEDLPDDDDDEKDDDDDEKDDDDEDTVIRKKVIRRKKGKTWLVIVLIAAGVLVLAGLFLLFLLLKKKKKKAQEAVAAAEEDSPTDFPNPPES